MGDTKATPAPSVRVRAENPHTYDGKAYEVGDEYDIVESSGRTAEEWVDTVQALQFARRVEFAAPSPAPAEPTKGKKAAGK